MSTETRTGWVASTVVHGILLLIFFFVSIPEIIQNQDFIEVTWGAPASMTPAREATSAAEEPSSSSPAVTTITKADPRSVKPSQPVILPERRMADPSREDLPLQKAEKLETPQEGLQQRNVEVRRLGEREGATGSSVGERERSDPSSVPGSTAGVLPGSGGPGGGIEKGVSFSIQWTQGGTRRKISGELPQYPPGVNVETQIKILAVVLPDGSVQSTQPAQKGNTKLEEVAMKEVRFWKFEPLRLSQPQQDQSCLVTFLFTLK